jgi:hypothetical protein
VTPAAITSAAISCTWLIDQAAHHLAIWMGPAMTYTVGPWIVVAGFATPLALLGALGFVTL